MDLPHALKIRAGILPVRLLPLVVVVLALIGGRFWIYPWTAGLYYLVKGGNLLKQIQVTVYGEQTSDIACNLPPVTDTAATNRLKQAVYILHKSLAYNESLFQADLLLGRAYCLLGEIDDAKDSYRTYIDRNPENPLGHLELGFVYELLCTGYPISAPPGNVTSAENGVKSCPNDNLREKIASEWLKAGVNGDQFISNGEIARQQHNLEEAIKWYREAAIIGTPESEFYILLTQGQIYQTNGKWELAVYEYQRSIKVGELYQQPVSTPLFFIGLIQKNFLNQPDLALDNFTQAIITNQFLSNWDLPNTYCHRGIIERNKKEFNNAIQDFQNALKLIPNHYCSLMELGSTYWDFHKDLAESMEYLSKAIAIAPKEKWAYIVAGNIYLEATLPVKALEMFKKAIEIDPTDVEIRNQINRLSSP